MTVIEKVSKTRLRRHHTATPERRHAGFRVLVLVALVDLQRPVTRAEISTHLDTRNPQALEEVLEDLTDEGTVSERDHLGETRYALAASE